MPTTCLKLVLPAVPAGIGVVRNTVAVIAEESGATAPVVDAVRLAVTEAVTNAVRHAYPSGMGEIEVRVDRDGSELVVYVVDDGIGMPEDRRGEPGLGLRLIESLASVSSISPGAERGTEVRLLFAIGPAVKH
jgi:two-component sensor histidine kinase